MTLPLILPYVLHYRSLNRLFGFAYVELEVQDVRLIVVSFARDDNILSKGLFVSTIGCLSDNVLRLAHVQVYY